MACLGIHLPKVCDACSKPPWLHPCLCCGVIGSHTHVAREPQPLQARKPTEHGALFHSHAASMPSILMQGAVQQQPLMGGVNRAVLMLLLVGVV
jgi:hypothetical protein